MTAMFMTLSATAARAQLLEQVLPVNIPGYDSIFAVTPEHHPPRPEASGVQWGTVSFNPAFMLSGGYDSAPDGRGGSALLSLQPSLAVADLPLGLAAYAAANGVSYPQNTAQNTSGFTLAMGERAVLPRQTIMLSAGYLRAQESGFAIDTLTITRPVRFQAGDLRVSDEVSLGMFTLKPELSRTVWRFSALPAQNRTDDREDLTTTYLPGGPLDVLLRLHATQSRYRAAAANADTYQLLAGVTDDADAIWHVSALAGLAQRRPRRGRGFTAPVLEARLDWMPGALDQIRLDLLREIDDPDALSAAPYTLTQADVTLTHAYVSNVLFKFKALASNAEFMHSPLRETLFSLDADVNWQVSAALAINGDYEFNDRQANFLRAANEHVVSLGLTWTP